MLAIHYGGNERHIRPNGESIPWERWDGGAQTGYFSRSPPGGGLGEVPLRKKSVKDSLPKESTIYIVPRAHPYYPDVEVKNRSKFEALFRDFQSLNVVPDNLTENDRLLLYKAP